MILKVVCEKVQSEILVCVYSNTRSILLVLGASVHEARQDGDIGGARHGHFHIRCFHIVSSQILSTEKKHQGRAIHCNSDTITDSGITFHRQVP